MERIYIEYDLARFTRKDLTLVDLELFDGRKFAFLEVRLHIPFGGVDKGKKHIPRLVISPGERVILTT